jgi:hypothetical protein
MSIIRCFIDAHEALAPGCLSPLDEPSSGSAEESAKALIIVSIIGPQQSGRLGLRDVVEDPVEPL